MGERNYRLQDIQLWGFGTRDSGLENADPSSLNVELERSVKALERPNEPNVPNARTGRKIVWDDRLCDEVSLIAAPRIAGPQAEKSLMI